MWHHRQNGFDLVAGMIRRKPTRTMWWGEEAQCSKCFGWWPVEKEFFPQIVNGRAHGACRACRLESDPRRKQEKIRNAA